MDTKLRKIYVPMTESAFYILFHLQNENHGYNIIQQVRQLTNQEVIISAGTMYGTLSKMEKDQLITFTKEVDKRKYYRITDLGNTFLQMEIRRIKRLYENSIGGVL